MTGPAGGRLAMAGAAGGVTMLAPWRGRGTIRRGAGASGVVATGAGAGATAAGAFCRCRYVCVMRDRRRGRDYGLRAWRRGGSRGGLGLFALEDGFEGIAGLGDVLEVEARLGFDDGFGGGWATAALEVGADLLGLVFLDRTGVRLSRHANRFERVEDRPALYFQFPRQIVDSNFAHPSLFSAPAPLAAHISLMYAGISIVSLVSEIAAFASPVFLVFVACRVSHGRFRPYLALRPQSPGSGPPVRRLRRYRVRSALRGHRYR